MHIFFAFYFMLLYTRICIRLRMMFFEYLNSFFWILYVLIQNKRDTSAFSRLRQTQFAVFHAWSEFPTKRRQLSRQNAENSTRRLRIQSSLRRASATTIAYGAPHHRNLRAFREHKYATIIPHAYPPSFWKENTFSRAEHRGDASQLPLMNARIHLHSKCSMQWSTKEIGLPE